MAVEAEDYGEGNVGVWLWWGAHLGRETETERERREKVERFVSGRMD